MKIAALDLGSNTFLCLIAEVHNQEIINIYYDEVEVVRLGQGLSLSKKFHPDALIRAEKCLERFSKVINKHQPEKILAMATSAARDAENKNELIAIANKFNIPIEIIPGDQEAQITYSGSVSASNDRSRQTLVVDIGGGSTEFIFGLGKTLIRGQSFDIGCVRLTEKFIFAMPARQDEIKQLKEYIHGFVNKAKQLQPDHFNNLHIVAVAGTPTALVTAMIGGFDALKIDGYKLTCEELKTWLLKLSQSSVAEIEALGIPTGRADVILSGVVILIEILEIFQLPFVTVSTRGVRHGVALEVDRRHHH